FLQLHQGGRHNTVIFPGGLPFHQRHGARMLDVILVPEGETATAFELGVSLDREQPMQTALGVTSPVGVVACDQGPPHVGAAGWPTSTRPTCCYCTSSRPRARRRASSRRWPSAPGTAGRSSCAAPATRRAPSCSARAARRSWTPRSRATRCASTSPPTT